MRDHGQGTAIQNDNDHNNFYQPCTHRCYMLHATRIVQSPSTPLSPFCGAAARATRSALNFAIASSFSCGCTMGACTQATSGCCDRGKKCSTNSCACVNGIIVVGIHARPCVVSSQRKEMDAGPTLNINNPEDIHTYLPGSCWTLTGETLMPQAQTNAHAHTHGL